MMKSMPGTNQAAQDLDTQPQISVVIPAFKAEFLPQALASLEAQTDRNFEVVVADDASPADLRAVCEAFSGTLSLRYLRFDSNMGRTDLVGHWTRAIDAASHDWIWLMGDDDELEPGCVAAMRSAIKAAPDWLGLWHMDVTKIDAKGEVQQICPSFPGVLDAPGFLVARCNARLSSFACEYVFRRSTLRALGGFVRFPLAWCSDDATWLRLAGVHGIRTVRAADARARWRSSLLNISGRGAGLNPGKLEARLQYMEWLASAETARSLGFSQDTLAPVRLALRSWFFSSLLASRTRLGLKELWPVAMRIGKSTCTSPAWAAIQLMRYQRWMRNAGPGS
jgi:hypothetical protein